ncbi:endonuclease/exonuclease/phosphatase family metal-dependent hydrolase [Catalinimonas alkaloidigena]|uniref:endonuclease/exonuclease/phosphatase family protein n=1 Tax=Catalinimonas alkaloidigena TaxID=1075417 RepID=UPI00240582C9|nr:endonuclease/exonuclease/phosphatase family protein [Catalinimonas alkaloidigena]MDF9801033.1 endonuclease/exonuclease/phosphatase family metal-dependent hydrolase [Catalinimonas alkaloidigena]
MLAYLSPYISPASLWITGFLSLAIPVLLLINIALLCFLLVRLQTLSLLHLCVLVLGYPYIASSFSYNPKPVVEEGKTRISVLNYNVRVFNTYAYLQNKNIPGKSMVNWLANTDADIKCLQEFYNDNSSDIFNTTEKLGGETHDQVVVKPAFVNRIGAQFGLAIFSRYPIIYSGDVNLDDIPHQHAIFADINVGQDTIRIYNIHLQSMSIDENKIGDFEQENYLNIAKKLKFGFIERAKQVDNLVQHIGQSPYPVIVCGDFNDLPYSYTYFTLKEHLSNAFEEAGNGFGFSYNGKLFFLRIDHQFYSEQLQPLWYRTHRDVPYSDHFPIQTEYVLHN